MKLKNQANLEIRNITNKRNLNIDKRLQINKLTKSNKKSIQKLQIAKVLKNKIRLKIKQA